MYAPKVTGFKKDVVVKYKDASKIKSATVNEKAFKSTIRIKKSGHYTITVKDVISNKRAVKFTIKK